MSCGCILVGLVLKLFLLVRLVLILLWFYLVILPDIVLIVVVIDVLIVFRIRLLLFVRVRILRFVFMLISVLCRGVFCVRLVVCLSVILFARLIGNLML